MSIILSPVHNAVQHTISPPIVYLTACTAPVLLALLVPTASLVPSNTLQPGSLP